MKQFIYIFLLAGFTYTLCNGQSLPNKNKVEPSKAIHLTMDSFLTKVADYKSNSDWKYLGDKPAIIDFYADWCGPCKKMSPILEELAAAYGDQIYVYKIDIEEERELAALFGVKSIPFFLLIPMDEWPKTMLGAAPKDYLEEVIGKFLLKKEEEKTEESPVQ
jgi:thioredoxin